MIVGWSFDEWTFFWGTDSYLDGMKGTVIDRKSIDRKISTRRLATKMSNSDGIDWDLLLPRLAAGYCYYKFCTIVTSI